MTLLHVAVGLILGLWCATTSVTAKAVQEVSPFHAPDEAPNLTIFGQFKSYIYNRKESLFDLKKRKFIAPYHLVKMKIQGHRLDADIRLRGGVRFCDSFPHFKLKLRDGIKMDGGTTFKLVTHGTFSLDARETITAPACGNELGKGPESGSYYDEYVVYRMANELLEFSFKVYPAQATYRDPTSGLVVEGFSFLIEDNDRLAERNQLQKTDFGFFAESDSFKQRTSDFRNLVVADEIMQMWVRLYESLQQNQPDLSAEELSASLPDVDEIERSGVYSDLKRRANARLNSELKKLGETHAQIWQRTSIKHLTQVALFNILIANIDWAFFDLHGRSDGLHNLYVFEDKSGSYIAVPYDFDLAGFGNKNAHTNIDSYRSELQKLFGNLRDKLGEQTTSNIFLENKKIFATKLRSFLDLHKDIPEFQAKKISDFIAALSAKG